MPVSLTAAAYFPRPFRTDGICRGPPLRQGRACASYPCNPAAIAACIPPLQISLLWVIWGQDKTRCKSAGIWETLTCWRLDICAGFTARRGLKVQSATPVARTCLPNFRKAQHLQVPDRAASDWSHQRSASGPIISLEGSAGSIDFDAIAV